MPQKVAVTVNILDKAYQVSCLPGEEAMLEAAAQYLTQQMRDIRDRGNIIGADRIAVMAALNIAHELLQLRNLVDERQKISDRISVMQQSVAKLLKSDVHPSPREVQ